MARYPSSDEAERLLRNATARGTGAEDGRLARLLSALRAPASPGEGSGEQAAIASIVTAVHEAPVPLAARRRRRRGPVRSAKTAALAAAMVLAATTAAAAATGSLPDSAQRAVSDALAHVNVSVPSPDDHGAPAAKNEDAKGPDATGSAKYGLCTAWSHGPPASNTHSRRRDSVAFRNVQQAATDAGQTVEEFCADAKPPAGDDETSTSSTPSGEHGPKVTTPNDGGTGTADGASGGASEHGTDKAPPAATNGGDNGKGTSTTSTPGSTVTSSSTGGPGQAPGQSGRP